MTKMRNGKLPVGTKSKILTYEEVFGGGSFELPPEVKADMEKRGLVPKWLNGDEVQANHGRHKRGWKVYYAPDQLRQSLPFGENDGTIRNGDLVLGVKTKEEHALHKQYLAQRAELEGNRELILEEFERQASRAGVKVFREE